MSKASDYARRCRAAKERPEIFEWSDGREYGDNGSANVTDDGKLWSSHICLPAAQALTAPGGRFCHDGK